MTVMEPVATPRSATISTAWCVGESGTNITKPAAPHTRPESPAPVAHHARQRSTFSSGRARRRHAP